MELYTTKIEHIQQNYWIKVYLAQLEDLEKIKYRLEVLNSVKKVNISNNQDLTVYPRPPFPAQDAENSIKRVLNAFYDYADIARITIGETVEIRNSFPKQSTIHQCYDDALNKLLEARYSRNALDDIRLALELYLKEVLSNHLPLEKQSSNLKEYLTQKGVSSEIVNITTQSLHNLTHYFNNHTKHDDKVNEKEVDLVVGYSNQIMKCVLNI